MPVNQSNNGKNQSDEMLETYSEVEQTSQVLELNKKQSNSDDDCQESVEIEESPERNLVASRLKTKIATLIGSAVVLPILAVGTACYYFGTQAIDEQLTLARRSNLGIVQTELVRQRNLLTALLIGTGTTALVAGAIAVSGTRRLIEGQSEFTSDPTQVDESELDSWQDIARAIVEEVRSDLHCDRVVVYSLEPDRYGTVVAESVAAGYTRAMGTKIDRPFETQYLERYGNGVVKAIDDLDKVNLSLDEREGLKQLEVKASLVTPIFCQERLLGLLVVHQCIAPRKWQQSEINLLHRTAQKAGLTIENAINRDLLSTLQTEAEKEGKYRHYFNYGVRHIRQSLESDEILDISVEFVHRVLKCDRVVIYSLQQDNYGLAIAESVSADYSRALDRTLAESFATQDLEGDSEVRAIDDIYQAQLSQEQIEQLETLQVKAYLAASISNRGKVEGLLVAHQCDRPRHWQNYEVRWMDAIAVQIGLALDNARVRIESAAVRDTAETERKWTYYFDEAVRHIRQSLKPNDILNISVEYVHRILKCDRAVVYSLQDDNYGVVIAESLSAGRSRALNKTIEDLDRDGKVGAIDDIYQAQLSQKQIEQLETLQVKAKLVMPISNKGKVEYLLVAHQCDRPRHWQDYEVRWMSAIAVQIGLALDNANLLKKLAHDEQLTQLLNDFSFKITQTANTELLNIAVEQVRKIMKLDRAIVYQFDSQDRATVVAESVGSGYSSASLNDYLTTEESQNSPKIEAIADIHKSNLSDRQLKQLESLTVKATITAAIVVDKQLYGLLIGHQCQQPRSWSQQETNLFTQLALQIGLVLDRVRLEELAWKNNYSQPNNSEQNFITAIVKPTDAEKLNLLEPDDLYQMLGTLHDLRYSDRQTNLIESAKSPMKDITIEAEEITLNLEKSPAAFKAINPDLTEDISELSDRISQQSLFVTESFQKLAILAKQLSKKDQK